MIKIPPTRVAFVGAGNMAREHLRAFASIPGVTLAGICSRTRSKADALATEFGVTGVHDSIPDLFNATQAELVVVTVFETAMRAVSGACFEFPWAVLLEKPPGYDLDEGRRILEAAGTRKVYVGLNRRFLSSTRTVLDGLRRFNEPRFVHVQDQQSLETARVIGHPPQVVANWMYANSIHLVDYLPALGRGRIAEVNVIQPWRGESTRVVLAEIRFDSGDVAFYQAIWDGPGPWAVSVSTRSGRWEMRPLEQVSFQAAGTRVLTAMPVGDADTKFKPGFRLQAEHVLSAIRGGSSEAVTLGAAMETMELIGRIYQS